MKRMVAWIVLLAAGSAFGQGGLTPSGAPAATMKTLDEIYDEAEWAAEAAEMAEPRSDVTLFPGNEDYHHVITLPGSYYLSGNLTVTNDGGILIATNGVALDLQGFEVRSSTGNKAWGINISPEMGRITICNGSVSGFNTGVGDGTRVDVPRGTLYEDLSVSYCSFGISAGTHSQIINCRVYNTFDTGISARGGSVIQGCTVSSNYATGIVLYDGSISQCSAYKNENRGFIFWYGVAASDCSAYDNESDGFKDFSAGSLNNCVSVNNAGNGFDLGVGSSIHNSVAQYNSGHGISLGGKGCRVVDNLVKNNGVDAGVGAGIHVGTTANHIESNTLLYNDWGITVTNGGNFIVRNSASSNGTNYNISASNSVGTIQTSPVGAGAWDNFSF